jgi:AcrR family transcriptional regulator
VPAIGDVAVQCSEWRDERSMTTSSEPDGQAGGGRRPGRPRTEGIDERILQVTLARLGREGYEGLRVDDVASDAGVAKTTLYRRWPSKDQLVADAVRHIYADRAVDVDSGNLRSDLLALLTESVTLLFEGPGRILEDLVRESGTSRELASVVKATNHARRRAYHEALNRAVARGEIPPTIQHELLIDLLVGPLWTRSLVTGSPMTDGDVEAIVDTVLDGCRDRTAGSG